MRQYFCPIYSRLPALQALSAALSFVALSRLELRWQLAVMSLLGTVGVLGYFPTDFAAQHRLLKMKKRP